MKNFDSFLTNKSSFLHRYCLTLIAIYALIFSFQNAAYCQNTIPTKGKDFWVAFPYIIRTSGGGAFRCELFITSQVATSGVVSIPKQSWSTTFTVLPNQTTTVSLPLSQVEHFLYEVTDNKGVNITANDTISVFAISFQNYSSDATIVYPKQTLGTEYRIGSYRGLNYTMSNSNFQIVATEDGTEIEIIPSVNTLGGKVAGVPFTINLNAGESYQVLAAISSDLTGTIVRGTPASGTCRPFSVFSGSGCVNIPIGCTACDIIYEQSLPLDSWGKTYYSTPFSNASSFTLRVLADQNGTSVSINGGTPFTLNAGQFTEFNNVIGTRCISASKRISVIQYMQGASCSGGGGDPSMMFLNSNDQKIDEVTFSTVQSVVINQHFVNIIINANYINQILLDGNPISASLFLPFTFCNSMSYAKIPITQGSHTLKADSGFTAYVYGMGSYESYAYSVGYYSKIPPIQIDSIICSTDTVFLGTSNNIFDSWWSTAGAPNDTLGIGLVLTLVPPIKNELYIQHANTLISGCPIVHYFNVESPIPPQLTIELDNDTVCYNQTVQLNALLNPLSSNFNFLWTPSNLFNNANIANPIYTADSSRWIKVRVSSIQGCTTTFEDSIFIHVLPRLPQPSSAVNLSVCNRDSITISASTGTSYLWQPGGMITDSITIHAIANTNYIVLITDSNGCMFRDTFNITLKSLPTVNAGIDKSICKGNFVTITGSGSGNLLWTPTGSTSNSITINPSTTTNYSLQVTGPNGCTNTDTVMVTVHDLPNISAGNDQSICINDSATLIVTPGYSYIWSPANLTNDTIVVYPQTTTTYIVIATNIYMCRNRDTVLVTVNQTPPINASNNQSICFGDSITLNASGGTTYLWTPGNLIGDSVSVNPSINTMYYVVGFDSIGCSKKDSVLITVNQLPQFDLGPAINKCIYDTINLVSPIIGSSYLWQPGGSSLQTSSFVALNYSIHTLLITDINGCKKLDSIYVNVNPLPIISAGNDFTICSGTPTQINASGATNYLWLPTFDSTSTITVTPQSTTTYTVIGTDINQCSSSDTLIINVDPSISGSSSFIQICLGDQLTLTDSGGVSYLWTPNGSTSSSITVSPTNTILYIVDITTPIGCKITDTMNVYVNNLPSVSVGQDQAICIGDTASITATGAISYLWSPINNYTNNILVAPLNTTSYIVTGTNSNGCKNYDTISIVVNPLPLVIILGDTIICPNTTTQLNATGAVNYLWTLTNDSSSTISVSPSNGSTYNLIGIDNNGCLNKDSITLFFYDKPIANFSASKNNCANKLIQFTNLSSVSNGSIQNSYWDFGNGTTSNSFNPAIFYNAEGTFPVKLICQDANGCYDSITHPVMINPNPIANFSGEDGCALSNIEFNNLSTISAGKINNWFWDFGDTYTSTKKSPEHVYEKEGDFDVMLEATSDSGCIGSLTYNNLVKIHPLPIANFSAYPLYASILNPKIEFTDLSIGGTNWDWDFGDNNGYSLLQSPVYNYTDTGFFNVQLINTTEFGCKDTAYGQVYIEPYFTIYIPNAFTPNGDDKNETWQPKGLGIAEMQLEVYDRWGKKVFTTNNLNEFWDGRSYDNLEFCSEGVYTYVMNVINFKGLKFNYEGIVNIIR